MLSKFFVDNIIFGGQDALCKDFANQMKHEFEMLMFGEIKFFVRLKVYQLKYGIFITQSKYTKEILKKFRLEDKHVIGTKWIYQNKLDENGEFTRNKERLVCKGYAQEEGIDYGETFSPVARLEGVRNLLSYVVYNGFKVYQMDVKFAFLNSILEEEVYIEKLEGIFDANNKKHGM